MENIQETTNVIAHILRMLAAGALGLFAGAMLTEGLLLVPYWRALNADAFYAWYGANDKRLVGFFGPLTWVAATAALVSGVVSVWAGVADRPLAAAAAVLSLCVVAMFPVYFKRANASFSAGRMPAEVLRGELGRWAKWHWARIVLSLAAFAAAMLAI